MKRKLLSCVWLFTTPWTIQPLELSRPEYWSGEPFPSPGDLPNSEIKPESPVLQADSLPTELSGNPILTDALITSGVIRSLNTLYCFHFPFSLSFYISYLCISLTQKNQKLLHAAFLSLNSFLSQALYQVIKYSSTIWF